MEKRDVVIIGGGASGVALAINLKKEKANSKITILEQNDKILKKVLKTGNGKCNISNSNIKEEYYNNYSFFGKWVKEFDVINYFKDLGIILKEDNVGRLYPYSESSNSVVDILRDNLEKLNIEVITDFLVKKVEKKEKYIIYGNKVFESKFLVFATGSYAQQKTNGYDLCKMLGHSITDIRPVLTPLKVYDNVKPLQGIRIKCEAKVNDFRRYGEILFKEDGLSGILSLELSRYISTNDEIFIDLVPNISKEEIKEFLYDKDDILIALNGLLPKMIAQFIYKKSSNIDEIIKNIKECKFKVKDFYGYNYSQIVRGGVSTLEVKDDFESKKNNNLYIVGEVLDIDGDCGGYNLYFAWLSAYVAAKSICKSIY